MPNETLLVVDDEQVARELVVKILSRHAYEVISAASGPEALQRVAQRKPDLIVLDVMMPGMDGFEVCRRLRADPETKNIPILMLSARDQVGAKVTGLEAGADDYVTKPIASAELLARVRGLLERTRRLLAEGRAPSPSLVLGFLGAKGGVGTTATALNVAVALGDGQERIIVAEVTSSLGSLAAMLNQKPTRNVSSLLRMEPAEINADVVRTHLGAVTTSVRALFSPQRIEDFVAVRREQAQALLKTLCRLADVVVLDLPSVPSVASGALVPHLDFLAMVVEPEPVCIASAEIQLDLVRAWSGGLGATGIIIINRASLATPLTYQDISRRLGSEIIGVVPQAAQALLVANQAGKPLLVSQPEGPAADAYREIARRLTHPV